MQNRSSIFSPLSEKSWKRPKSPRSETAYHYFECGDPIMDLPVTLSPEELVNAMMCLAAG